MNILVQMPAYYRSSLEQFLGSTATSIIGDLALANAAAKFKLTPEAIEAWRDQLPPLFHAVEQLIRAVPSSSQWHILLEYPIPVVGKRIDAVMLAHNLVVVIETKTGASPTSAMRQADDYALNLACFHEESSGRIIVPLVISDSPTAADNERTDFDALIEDCRVANSANVGEVLESIVTEYVNFSASSVDAKRWDGGLFKPIPPIIDAAVALYSDMDVFEIGHSCAAREDLNLTTEAIVQAVRDAREIGQKAICFVTGVPGAGKTLVGLNAVHHPEIKSVGSFLSGNGPLVKVIREALVRDVVHRKGSSRKKAELEVQTFVYNVHRFADQFVGNRQTPVQKVVVFDEAQRAWDAEQNKQKDRPEISEAHMMLDVMNRHEDWAVIVALIGGGQEINRGEAGIAEWGRALANFPQWQIYASPDVLSGGNSTAGFRLFEDKVIVRTERIHETSSLHLTVCTRSIRAQRMSDWVNAVISGDSAGAAQIGLPARPLLTRNLST
ncbi:MAG TPA: DNA/RNA helicase domain-containing protein, partial [Terriglobales bacterium]|nr:DNA/RNA helicase domain-containing protein [Terriglobales bacterium]